MDFKKAKTVVVKIGSALLTSSSGSLRKAWLESLAEDIAALKKSGTDVIVVSSGAVALGKKPLGLKGKKLKLEEKQAAAAVGQPILLETYRAAFRRHKLEAAQILLSIEDSENRRRYLNARSTLFTLMHKNAVPVINENDSVATEELRFGDNDRLAARVAQMVGANLLILLSDIDGLYDKNPRLEKGAKHIPVVKKIDSTIEGMAGGSLSGVGSGGMITKVSAAKIALHGGCSTVIAKGTAKNPVKALFEGGKHTLFVSAETPLSAKKHWIADTLHTHGTVVIDEGAANALKNGKSLLPAGVKQITGSFERGDAVEILSQNGTLLARGLVAYNDEDARRIIGHNTKEIEGILGFSGRDALIHRDDLVLLT